MTVTVSTPARSLDMAALEAVRVELQHPTSDDTFVRSLIRSSSAAIVRYCHRQFAREAVTETIPGFGGIHLQLSRRPIIVVTAVRQDESVITDYTVADREEGLLYRQAGWTWSVQRNPLSLARSPRWMDAPEPLPGQEEPIFGVDLVAGYTPPGLFLVNASTISVDAADRSFNDSASGFPPDLRAGDILEASGFDATEDNGRFEILTATAAKIVVTTAYTLVAEAASKGPRTIRFPGHKDVRAIDDVEKACIEEVKTRYSARLDDGRVIEKQLGPARVRFSEADGADARGLSPSAIGYLAGWVAFV